jgi:mxaA protein
MKIRFNPFYVFAIAALLMLLVATRFAHAEGEELLPTVKDGVVDISIIEPERSVGYTVGDIVARTVTLTIKKPYKLLETSLPIVGYERRYKNQLVGIDLYSISKVKKEDSDTTTYVINLAYQIFTNNVVAKHGALPQEYLKISDGGKNLYKFRIPSFDIAISPIAIFGAVKIENDMSPLRGPLLLDPTPEKQRLKVLVTILALSLLGLLYILGRRAWLPMMGGPFARAYRVLNKLPKSEDGLQKGVSTIHAALNATAGNSIFRDNTQLLLDKKQRFAPMQADLEKFFDLSRHVFFESGASQLNTAEGLAWLKHFCRRCRDCERGLRPEKITPEAALETRA